MQYRICSILSDITAHVIHTCLAGRHNNIFAHNLSFFNTTSFYTKFFLIMNVIGDLV